MKRRIILLAFAFIFLFSLTSAPFVNAQASNEPQGQGNWWFPNYNDFITKVNEAPENEIFGERYTHAQVSWIVHSVLNIIVGPIAACADEPNAGECINRTLRSSNDQGAILPLALMSDGLLKTKPASGVNYVASRLERLSLIDSAYAQNADQAGFGFANSLAIVQPLWLVARDAAYALVILAILVLAFMVMLRAKLNPQTVITVQSALPKVAIGLLLITFSYAIAGFMVDIVYVLQGLVSGMVASSALSSADAFVIFTRMNESIGVVMTYSLSFALAFFHALSPDNVATGDFSFGNLVNTGLAVFSGAISIIVLLIVFIVLLITIIRIYWVLLRTYVVVIMLVIISPFIMLMGIIRGGSIGNWFKMLTAQLSVFFIVSFIPLLAHVLLFSTNEGWLLETLGSIDINGFPDPNPFNLLYQTDTQGSGYFPAGFSFGGTAFIGMFVSFAALVSTPKLASSVRDFIATGRGEFGFDTTGVGTAGKTAGTYGAARAITHAEDVAEGEGVSPPAWTQAARSVFKIRS